MMSPATTQPNSTTISIPPISLPSISSIDPYRQRLSSTPGDLSYQQHAMSRQLPMPQSGVSAGLRHDSMPRPIYPSGPHTVYPLHSGRMALPPTADPHLAISGRSQKKEVKRRTKTGCMTCRKRRIKCDEGRPECRNCQKSKRDCAGYDPIFHSQSVPSPLLSAPTSNPPSYPSGVPPPSLPHPYTLLPPIGPSVSSKTPSPETELSPETSDYPSYPTSEVTLPPLQYHRPNQMDETYDTRGPAQFSRPRKALSRTIEELCTIDGHKRPNLPPLPDVPPNLDALQKIYDSAFAPGLDRLLETRWYSKHGFTCLVADRSLLAQFLAYITLVHQHGQSTIVASQEARVTWGLLRLCLGPSAHSGNNELRMLGERAGTLEVLMTSKDLVDVSEMSKLHDKYREKQSELEPDNKSRKPLQRQLAHRSTEFWDSFIHSTARLSVTHQDRDTSVPYKELEVCREKLDAFENRDIIFSIMTMHWLGCQADRRNNSDASHDDGQALQDWNVAKTFLEKEARGEGTQMVFGVICGIALRAWDWQSTGEENE